MKNSSFKIIVVAAIAALSVSLTSCSSPSFNGSAFSSANNQRSISSSVSQTQQASSTAQSSTDVQYYFPRAGQEPEPVLAGLIGNAKDSLDVAIYSITDSRISDAIIAAKNRGVNVRVISDKTEAKNSSQKKILNSLVSAGIPVKINKHSGLMHLKVTIVDQSIATTGSFNYTKGAENENDEVFVVLHQAEAAKNFDTQFDRMWGDTKSFNDYR